MYFLVEPATGSWILLSPAALSTETQTYANSSFGCPTDPTVSLAVVWELLVPPLSSSSCCLTQRDVQRRLMVPSITSFQLAYPAPLPCISCPWALTPLFSLKGHPESIFHWRMVMGIKSSPWGWWLSRDTAPGAARRRNNLVLSCPVAPLGSFASMCVEMTLSSWNLMALLLVWWTCKKKFIISAEY